MKIHLKFNHKKEELLDAIDSEIDSESMDYQIKGLIKKCINSDDIQKSSQISEMIHDELDYSIILFLATKSIEERLGQVIIESIKNDLKNFLGL